MKKILSMVFIFLSIFPMSVTTFAEEQSALKEIPSAIIVGEKKFDINDFHYPPYYEGNLLMVPLRKIGEALGYTIEWDSQTGAITIDDNYIQKATLYDGTATIIFEGHLKVIDMSRKIESTERTVIHNGYTFVPLEFFKEFFNDTIIRENEIEITPSKSELQSLDIS